MTRLISPAAWVQVNQPPNRAQHRRPEQRWYHRREWMHAPSADEREPAGCDLTPRPHQSECEQGETFGYQGQRDGHHHLATVPPQLLGHREPGNLGDPPQAGRQGDKRHGVGGEDSPTRNIGQRVDL
ncbi:hypothetical protein GCM10020000_78970 [Streptomyces olivoverticillatus]